MSSISIPLVVTGDVPSGLYGWPVTRGAPLPPGAVADLSRLTLTGPDAEPIPVQLRALSRWPDGRLHHVLVDFNAHSAGVYTLSDGGTPVSLAPVHPLQIEEDEQGITVCAGPLRFRVGRARYGLFERVELKNEEGYFTSVRQSGAAGGEAFARISEGYSDGGTNRRLYGMGGVCRAALADACTVSIEESGPLRAVIRLDSPLEADIPAHHYAGYRPFFCTTRIYAFAGCSFVRVLHTTVMRFNPRETEVEELGLHIPVTFAGLERRFSFSTHRRVEGVLKAPESLYLAQRMDNHVVGYRGRGFRREVMLEGERLEGWMTLDDGRVGVGVAFLNMPEEHPTGFEISGDGDGVTAYMWRDPDGRRLSLKRYAEEVAWHEGEGVYADGLGIAKTAELWIDFYESRNREKTIARLRAALSPPHAAVAPENMALEADSGPAPFNSTLFPNSERMMTGFVEWMTRNIRLGRWYGFLDHGDVLAAYDDGADDWRFRGRWGWVNSEWDPRHGVWIQYGRTGNPEYFRLGEVMTRHSMDVDTCHYHPFRPYMVGGCFRHSVNHFSDEPCASHTFIDNWMDYYYLTGDGRTFDVIREAGDFFLKYRWSDNPSFSFSLRSIANTLRGLLHVYKATGETRYMRQAEAVYAVIVAGQNEDGSWNKRFHPATPDRLPDQAPYGMATEGTTLAVETGNAPPFTDAEYRALGGAFSQLRRVLPREEQKGYQTHYLMIGLEMFHRMTGRADVAKVYRRAVDWFCGYPDIFASDRPYREHYGGILCRHLAYTFELTGDRRYLETGQRILRLLLAQQDWSDNPKKRGAVGLSPMYLSLLFFGVPYLLRVMKQAGMEE